MSRVIPVCRRGPGRRVNYSWRARRLVRRSEQAIGVFDGPEGRADRGGEGRDPVTGPTDVFLERDKGGSVLSLPQGSDGLSEGHFLPLSPERKQALSRGDVRGRNEDMCGESSLASVSMKSLATLSPSLARHATIGQAFTSSYRKRPLWPGTRRLSERRIRLSPDFIDHRKVPEKGKGKKLRNRTSRWYATETKLCLTMLTR